MARPQMSSRFMMLRQRSRLLLLFLENACHRSSYIPIAQNIESRGFVLYAISCSYSGIQAFANKMPVCQNMSICACMHTHTHTHTLMGAHTHRTHRFIKSRLPSVLIRSRLPAKLTGYNSLHDLAGRLFLNLC
jgi:hypothetical protein